jgi:hypothetical protein
MLDPLAPSSIRSTAPLPKRKAKKTSPTQRSLALLRERGYLAQVVEHWNQFSRTRSDLFGFIDVLAVRDGEILGVQATSGSNGAARVTKIADHENVSQVRKAGIRIAVHAWSKRASGRWECKETDCS